MDIKDLNSLGGPLKKIERPPAEEVRKKKPEKQKDSSQTQSIKQSDEIQISKEARELQEIDDEVAVSRHLLSKLPNVRAHIIYEALAKIKAGMYSTDEVIERASAKLLESGELDDLFNS